VTLLRRCGAIVALLILAVACTTRHSNRPVDVQLLAINDFHGSLDAPAGSTGRIGADAVGGVEYLAAHLAALAHTNPNTAIVSAGDNIGASPLLSGMFHDEPTIEALGAAGLALSAIGNHELDEGWWELYRMQHGGCHPVDGCQDHTPFAGAAFSYLGANLLIDPARVDPQKLARSGWHPVAPLDEQPLFPPSAVKTFDGVKIGFIGLTLESVPTIVSPAALEGVRFTREADAANAEAARLEAQGVHAIVVLIHQGGVTTNDADRNGCEGLSGPIVEIARGMSAAIGVIVSGHTHRAYVCTVAGKLVTSASWAGRLITDIDLQLDPSTDRITGAHARNIPVAHDVPKAAAETAILDHYRRLEDAIGARQVGTLMATLPRGAISTESALGDLVADGMLQASRRAGAVVAFQNPGGIRADLARHPDVPAGTPSPISYADAFTVLPFGNVIVVKTMSGEGIVRMLEQQFDNPSPGEVRLLQVSRGFTYRYDLSQPAGHRVDRDSIRIDGQRLVPSRQYRVASNDFVWNSGDGFSVATEGTDPIAIGPDVDVLVDYLATASPIRPHTPNRIRRGQVGG
jgi:5'-nucleotidase